MRNFYVRVPKSTHEIEVCVPLHETTRARTFRIVFFESECSDRRMITISAHYEDDSNEIQSLSRLADEQDYNADWFEFRFEGPRGGSVTIEIYDDIKARDIYVKY